MKNGAETARSKTRIAFIKPISAGLVLFLGLWAAVSMWWPGAKVDTSRELARARFALKAGRSQEAADLAQQILATSPDHSDALLLAAEAESKLGNFQKAIQFYDQVSSGSQVVLARAYAAEIERHRGNLLDAVERFQAVLKAAPTNVLAHRRMAWIFNVQGCRQQAQEHLLALCRQQDLTVEELLLLGDRERLVTFGDETSDIADRNRQAFGIRLGQARLQYRDGRLEDARQFLHKLTPDLQSAPSWLIDEFQTLNGRIYLDNDDTTNLEAWRTTTLSDEISHPDLWLLHGEILVLTGNVDSVECLRNAIALAPNSQRAHYQLATALALEGRKEEAEKFRNRANMLRELAQNLNDVSNNSENLKAMLNSSRLCETLGRPWEAAAWQAFARQLVGQSAPPDWAMEGLMRELPLPEPTTPQTLETACLCRNELSRDHSSLPGKIRKLQDLARHGSQHNSVVTFRDQAKRVGLDFQYHSGVAARLSGRPMYSFPGGGVGVIDFDLDAWPDVYIPQGTTWPPTAEDQTFVDGVCRNVRGVSCQNVCDQAGIQESGFSHGVSVGDFDNDGFPDIYVANIFRNCLYHNLGDGTFEEFNVPKFPRHGWTTSCVIADMNGDGLPDLYDVNYAKGDGIYEMVCEKDGLKGTCTPMAFEPEADVFFHNNGDGTFSERTSDFGFSVDGGNGLGIAVGDFVGDRGCDIFVANDADPNFLFTGGDDTSGNTFVQIAPSSGLAVDGGGTPQACMGTAVADADGDQRIDLFVTNYYQEHNVLYSQVLDGVFVDSSSKSGLFAASYSMLGFGTQFIDADLDSWPDLFVANGHVDDFRQSGAEYAMRPQFFNNTSGGMFDEQPGAGVGAYFQDEHLGRGVASLDWNADGHPDIAVSHLDHPIALLINDTETNHHFLKLKIHATSKDRDGVGTKVLIETDDRTVAAQFVAGNGYMASNEKTVLTGVGTQTERCCVEIGWMGTDRVSYELNPDSLWTIVEGRSTAYRIPF